MAKYTIEFWNCFIPMLNERDFIQMTMKVNLKQTIKKLQEAESRQDVDGCITIDFLKKKADETKLYAKETIWDDVVFKDSEKKKEEHLPRAKPRNRNEIPKDTMRSDPPLI